MKRQLASGLVCALVACGAAADEDLTGSGATKAESAKAGFDCNRGPKENGLALAGLKVTTELDRTALGRVVTEVDVLHNEAKESLASLTADIAALAPRVSAALKPVADTHCRLGNYLKRAREASSALETRNRGLACQLGALTAVLHWAEDYRKGFANEDTVLQSGIVIAENRLGRTNSYRFIAEQNLTSIAFNLAWLEEQEQKNTGKAPCPGLTW